MKHLSWALALWLFGAITAAGQTADTIYYNGHIITVWNAHPVVEALAIRGDKFLAVGSNQEVLQTAGPATLKVNLQGRTVTPGLIESHVHPIMAALGDRDGQLPAFHSIADVQAYIRKQLAVVPPASVIIVPKVFATRLAEHRLPTRYELDAAAGPRLAMTDNEYSSALDSALLERLGITRDSAQPADGKIIKDERGEPTGLVLGAGKLMDPLRKANPPSFEDKLRALRSMQKRYVQAGLTSVIDRGQDAAGFRAYETLEQRGELSLRSSVTFLISALGTPQDVRHEIEAIPLVTGYGDDWVRVGSLKTIMDGGILTGTAYLRQPWGEHTEVYGYHDPTYRGVLRVPRENIFEMARVADELGWQMTAHVAGDGSEELLLQAYQAADKLKSIRDRRFCITHGNLTPPEAIALAVKLGVVMDSEIAFHYLDGPAVKIAFGPERMKLFDPYRSMFDAGMVVAGGSDHMIGLDSRTAINPYQPFFGMWMAITRRGVDGSVMEPEQRITRDEALRMWTLNGAYLTFDEKKKGSIEPGKLADFTVISKDYLACPEDEIKDIDALRTVVGGRIVYDKLGN
jgi:predicted amidohydrolase YtcJ